MKLSAACVVAVDVGSVRTGSFAWAAVDLPGHTLTAHGDDPAGAAGALSAALTDADGLSVLPIAVRRYEVASLTGD